MKKSLDYPQLSSLIAVLEWCPTSIFIYVLLWKKRLLWQTIVIKDKIQEEYLTDEDNFLKHLFDLQDAHVLHFIQTDKMFVVSHHSPDISAHGYTLC